MVPLSTVTWFLKLLSLSIQFPSFPYNGAPWRWYLDKNSSKKQTKAKMTLSLTTIYFIQVSIPFPSLPDFDLSPATSANCFSSFPLEFNIMCGGVVRHEIIYHLCKWGFLHFLCLLRITSEVKHQFLCCTQHNIFHRVKNPFMLGAKDWHPVAAKCTT